MRMRYFFCLLLSFAENSIASCWIVDYEGGFEGMLVKSDARVFTLESSVLNTGFQGDSLWAITTPHC